MRTLPALVGLFLTFSAGSAAAQSVAGPVLGYFLDPTQGALRPIRGIPGAATAGDPIELDLPFSEAWISAEHHYALAANAKNGVLVLIDLARDRASAVPLEGSFVRPHLVAISPGGGTAAVVDLDRRRVHVLSGLPHAPSTIAELDVEPDIADAAALAVSDDGTALLIATRSAVYVARNRSFERLRDRRGPSARSSFRDSHDTLISGAREKLRGYVARRQGFERLLEARRPSGISFFRDSHDALISDADENLIVLVRDVTGAAEISTLASQHDGIARPVAVQPSPDGRRVFVANAGAASVSSIDLDTGGVTHLRCSAAPTGLFPLHSASVFRLNDFTGAPLLVLDGGDEEVRIVFVPPPAR